MDGFRTARALVLDNDPNEAAPVIQALGRLGVGVLFHTGDEAQELGKLRGIRLLIVDMVLENLGATVDDPPACASTLVGTLNTLLEDDYHPIVIVCWTKHKEFKDEFEKAFRATFPHLQLDSVLLFEKDKLLHDADKLVEEVRKALTKTEPFSLLLDWEQQVHDATTDTTAELSRLVAQNRSGEESWGELAYKACASLAIAEGGIRLASESGKAGVAAFFGALNPLLLDRLDLSDFAKSEATLSCSIKLQPAIVAEAAAMKGRKSLLPEAIRGALNTMLHVASHEFGDEIFPGTVFHVPVSEKGEIALNPALPALDWSLIYKDTFCLGPPSSALPVLVEVTPPCDFAQRKAMLARLLPGYLVKTTDNSKIPSRSAYTVSLGPMLLVNSGCKIDGLYVLVLNAHFLVAAAISEIAKLESMFRLRQSALAQITGIAGAHVSRAGFMKIEP